ncbi:MAG: hypothetical protein NZ482_03655 [Gloeomargarita sp. SKYG98]|nr:hypothetical protein [Gloeomargarita sp. SKYG98]
MNLPESLQQLGLERTWSAWSFPKEAFVNEQGEPLPLYFVDETIRLSCQRVYVDPYWLRDGDVVLKGNYAVVAGSNKPYQLLCREPGEASPLPELVSIRPPDVVNLFSPLTQEQETLARQFQLDLVYLPDGQACLQERPFRYCWDFPVYERRTDWFYQRLLSAFDYLPSLVPKYGFNQAVLGFYALFPTNQHPALTEWLLSVPEKACVFCYRNGSYYFTGMPQVGSPDQASDGKIDWTLFPNRLRLPQIPLKFCHTFPVAGDDGIQLVYAPTDQRLRYSLARLLEDSRPEVSQFGDLCGNLLAIAREKSQLREAALVVVRELMGQTGLFSATQLALLVKELESLLSSND